MAESLPVTTPEIREKLLDDMCGLGQRYLDDGDVKEALRWLNSAADLGSDSANFELGKIYSYGNDFAARIFPRFTANGFSIESKASSTWSIHATKSSGDTTRFF